MTDLSFELSKALKDAGWPQPSGCDMEGYPIWSEDKREVAYSPSLEELIEGCPVSLTHPLSGAETPFVLVRAPNESAAGYGLTQILNLKGEGRTPKEAVARLWLALRRAGII